MRILTLSDALTALVFPVALCASSIPLVQTNHPPIVKIESPANNALFSVNSGHTFQIQVTDPEDGDSRYDEINAKEVLLELDFAFTKPANPARPAALDIMATNNCFNCHEFNARSLGPSFFEIAKRYPATAANTDTLTSRIRNGSSSIWGRTEKMPSHPELSTSSIRSTVQWILHNATRSDRAWYIGTSGLLHFNKPGTYTLTATYTDHGTRDQPARRSTGADRITIAVK